MLALLLILLAPANKSSALSCAEIPSVEEAYEKYDGVLIGYVDDVVRTDQNNKIHILVKRSFKGIKENKLIVGEDITWGAFWGPSEKGEEYLFFLRQSNNEWENPLCAPTMKVADASKELEFLKDKEITIQNTPSQTEEPVSRVEVKPDSTSWWIIAMVTVFLGVVGYAIFRFIRRP